jgi:hypothetical protein
MEPERIKIIALYIYPTATRAEIEGAVEREEKELYR